MSKLVGTVYAVQAIPRSLIDDRSINPHVYASSAGVELVAEPVALKPAAARELAKLLNDAADECDRAPANWCLVTPAMPPRCPFCLQPAPKAARSSLLCRMGQRAVKNANIRVTLSSLQ